MCISYSVKQHGSRAKYVFNLRSEWINLLRKAGHPSSHGSCNYNQYWNRDKIMNYLLEQYQTRNVMKIVFVPTEVFETVPSIAECLSVTACLIGVLTEGTVDAGSGGYQLKLQYNTIEAIHICYLQLSVHTIRLLEWMGYNKIAKTKLSQANMPLYIMPICRAVVIVKQDTCFDVASG